MKPLGRTDLCHARNEPYGLPAWFFCLKWIPHPPRLFDPLDIPWIKKPPPVGKGP